MTFAQRTFARRTVLVGATLAPVGLLAACANLSGSADPDATVKAAVAQSERDLVARYDAAIEAYPQLSERLTPLRDQHSVHLASITGSPATDESRGPAGEVPVATSAPKAVAALAQAEREASAQRVDACTQATNDQLAWLLSLIGASESQHAASLVSGTS